MLRFIVRRLLWLPLTIVLVTFIVYCAVRTGWHPEETYKRANPRATRAKVEQYLAVNGLYEGFGGFIKGYFQWLWRFVQGPDHWPRSIKGRALVYPPLRYSIFNTLRLAGIASVIGWGIGLTVGVLAARKPGSWFDSLANTTAFFLGAIPPFVSGVALQLIFAVELGWLPVAGVYPPGHQGFDLALMAKHLVLPVTVVTIQVISAYSRYMRASLLEVRSSDFVRTARSKGLSERQVLFRHGVRNAMIPIVTVLALDIGGLLGGLIITEAIFNYPGMGVYFLRAINNGDIPQLMPYLVIIVISVLFFNLVADVSYAYLDPRIRLD
ncbi:MAG: ABC transporter permease [Actinobacteria bacterium]|nr:ABC transporter permease [Actinomycetota bacterium]